MKERPILFSGDMVRAILDGRKTQTRRPAKFAWSGSADELMHQSRFDPAYRCPIGQPGDRLWVRETWAPHADMPRCAIYRCDRGGDYQDTATDDFRWRPSIHMPRWASRITLEIVRVSVERVQDITPENCRADGIQVPRCCCEPCAMGSAICTADAGVYVEAFRDLWRSIYGTWSDNPWVWAVEFRRVKP